MQITLPDDVRQFTRGIVDECELYSASIFLCDRTSSVPRLSHLFHYQISEEVKDRYERHTIFHDDPFTDPMVQERAELIDNDGLLRGDDRRVRRCDGSSRYWQFMNDHSIDVVGASTRRLLPRLYATIGFHRRRNVKWRNEVSFNRLDALARRLQDMAGGHMLRDVLGRAHGLSSFRTGYFDESQPVATTLSERLSPREIEISRLVCQGRQNKEIAYLADLSEHTVENHLRRIYAKLAIHNRSALVAMMSTAPPAGMH